MPNYHVYDDFRQSRSINSNFDWLVVYHFSQLVDNDENRVVAIAFPVREQWQSGHKVHGEVFPPMSWYRQGLQVILGLMSDCLWSQTNVASLDIAFDVSSQARPIVFSADQLSCFVNAKMPYKRIIVVITYHLKADNLWDIWELSVLEHSLNILSILQKACNSDWFYFFVFVLKFKQSQSHASDIHNVKTVSSNLVSERVPKSVELGPDNCSIYQNLVERGQLTRVGQKPRYSGQQGLQVVQDLDVFGTEGFFLFCILLRVLKQSISSSISLFLMIIDLKVVARELLSLVVLSGAQALCLHEPTEVVVVSEYKHLMLKPF